MTIYQPNMPASGTPINTSGAYPQWINEETTRIIKKMSSFGGLSVGLEMGNSSIAMQVLGDSTGNDPTDWPYLFAEYLAATRTNFYVRVYVWDDLLQDYGIPYQLTNPDAGAVKIGGGTQTRVLPSSIIPHITGDMDIRVKLKLSDWTPGAIVTPIARFGSVAEERAWYLSILTDGKLQFNFSTDGVDYNSLTSPNPITFSANETGWVRVHFDVDNGLGGWSATFYQSADGVTWTGLSTDFKTTTGAAVINNAVGDYEIGGRSQNGEVLPSGGYIYEVDIRDGLNGFSVAPRLPDLWRDRLTGFSHTVSGAPMMIIVNGSKPGANLAYLSDTTRIKKMTPNYGQTVSVISQSHNEGVSIDNTFRSDYSVLVDLVKERVPNIPIVAIAQNPELEGEPGHIAHAVRRRNLYEIASVKGLEILDVYAAFMQADPTPYMADNIHPNNLGSALWRDVVIAAIP